ncbi:MutS protein msh4 [Coelomomyces lativittatus]|nr:MutS protein msh4 [Coelomomyces lativittatus]
MGIFFAKESVNFHLEPISGTMMIDTFTARTLELVRSTLPAQSKTTLFDTLNFTKTMMGARLLRWTILQPLTDLETIENRLDAVDELSKNEMQYIKLSNALKDIPNVEALISASFLFKIFKILFIPLI